MINRRAQYKEGVVALKKDVDVPKKQILDQEAEITKLNTELYAQKTTFEEASKEVKEMDVM